MSETNFIRCRKCGEKDPLNGMTIGTIVSRIEISVKPNTGAYIPVAAVNRCCRCGWIENEYLIPGHDNGVSNAEKLGVTLEMVRRCYRQMKSSFFTLQELKSGEVQGAYKGGEAEEYVPDEFIEQKEARIF